MIAISQAVQSRIAGSEMAEVQRTKGNENKVEEPMEECETKRTSSISQDG